MIYSFRVHIYSVHICRIVGTRAVYNLLIFENVITPAFGWIVYKAIANVEKNIA